MSRSLGVAESKADIDEGSITGITTFNPSSSALIHFYGGTPVDQPAAVSDVTTTGATSTTNAYGYTTAAQADAVVTAINALLARVREIGIIAT